MRGFVDRKVGWQSARQIRLLALLRERDWRLREWVVRMETGIVYKEENFYSAFPCILRLRDRRLMVLFRRAPQRKPYSTHLDSESKAVAVYSDDNAGSWSQP